MGDWDVVATAPASQTTGEWDVVSHTPAVPIGKQYASPGGTLHELMRIGGTALSDLSPSNIFNGIVHPLDTLKAGFAPLTPPQDYQPTGTMDRLRVALGGGPNAPAMRVPQPDVPELLGHATAILGSHALGSAVADRINAPPAAPSTGTPSAGMKMPTARQALGFIRHPVRSTVLSLANALLERMQPEEAAPVAGTSSYIPPTNSPAGPIPPPTPEATPAPAAATPATPTEPQLVPDMSNAQLRADLVKKYGDKAAENFYQQMLAKHAASPASPVPPPPGAPSLQPNASAPPQQAGAPMVMHSGAELPNEHGDFKDINIAEHVLESGHSRADWDAATLDQRNKWIREASQGRSTPGHVNHLPNQGENLPSEPYYDFDPADKDIIRRAASKTRTSGTPTTGQDIINGRIRDIGNAIDWVNAQRQAFGNQWTSTPITVKRALMRGKAPFPIVPPPQ